MVEKKQLKDVTQKKKKAKPASENRTELKDVLGLRVRVRVRVRVKVKVKG